MLRKMTLMLVLSLVLLGNFAYAERGVFMSPGDIDYFSPEECLYVLDEGRHFPNEFRPLLAKVITEHPQYNKEEVVNLMVSAHQAIRKDKPEISIYEIAKGVERFSDSELGIDLETYVAAYVRSQTK